MKIKVSRLITMAFLSLFIGLNVYYRNSVNLIGDRLPMPFGYGASIVLSGSMEPELSIDDLIIVKKTDNYNVNDIVVYQEGRDLIVHRIIDFKDNMVQTQGDVNNVADPLVEMGQLKGIVVASIPKAGIIINLIKSPIGVFAILGSSFLLLEYSYRSEKKEESEEMKALREEIAKLKKEL